jgi:hypothetical protein
MLKNNFTGIKIVRFIHCIYEQVETRNVNYLLLSYKRPVLIQKNRTVNPMSILFCTNFIFTKMMNRLNYFL